MLEAQVFGAAGPTGGAAAGGGHVQPSPSKAFRPEEPQERMVTGQ